MSLATTQRDTLRELTARYVEIAGDGEQDRRRDLWRRHNGLDFTRPLIYTRRFAFSELPQARLVCDDRLFKHYEHHLRRMLYWHELGDDAVFQPWLTLRARFAHAGWGVATPRHYVGEGHGSAAGAFKVDYPLKDPADLAKLVMPRHEIDEQATERDYQRLAEAVGDLIDIDVDRGPAYLNFSGDISTQLFYLRGIENFMMDMIDRPEWLEELSGFLAEGIERAHQQAEQAGDWGLSNSFNQAMAYEPSLPDPAANARGVRRERLWGFMAAQELTAVSPEMHERFLLRFQRPILAKFGLTAYGCCEDLTRKIDMLRSIPNLRRIAVSPFADTPACAEQIGRDYVLSYRPSPADMVGYSWNEDRVKSILRRDLGACRDNGCVVDITLKDTETVGGDPERPKNFVRACREVIDELY